MGWQYSEGSPQSRSLLHACGPWFIGLPAVFPAPALPAGPALPPDPPPPALLAEPPPPANPPPLTDDSNASLPSQATMKEQTPSKNGASSPTLGQRDSRGIGPRIALRIARQVLSRSASGGARIAAFQ